MGRIRLARDPDHTGRLGRGRNASGARGQSPVLRAGGGTAACMLQTFCVACRGVNSTRRLHPAAFKCGSGLPVRPSSSGRPALISKCSKVYRALWQCPITQVPSPVLMQGGVASGSQHKCQVVPPSTSLTHVRAPNNAVQGEINQIKGGTEGQSPRCAGWPRCAGYRRHRPAPLARMGEYHAAKAVHKCTTMPGSRLGSQSSAAIRCHSPPATRLPAGPPIRHCAVPADASAAGAAPHSRAAPALRGPFPAS